MPPSTGAVLPRYALAILVVTAAFLLKIAFDPVLGRDAPFLLTFGAIMFSAWYGHWGPGLLATVLAAIGTNVFFSGEPHGGGLVPSVGLHLEVGDWVRAAVFVTEGCLVCWLTEELRSSRARTMAMADVQWSALARERAALEEKTAAEQNLRQSEQQLRLVIDGAPVFIAYCDCEHRYRFVNRGYAERFGLAREQIIGKPIAEVVGAAAYASLKPYIDATLAGEPVEFELPVNYLALGTRRMHCAYAPEIRPDGCITGLVAIITDVTERHQIQEQLRQNERELSRLVENLPDMIYRLDRELRHRYVSPVVERHFGLPAQAFLGKSMAEAGLPADVAALHDDACREALRTRQPTRLDFSLAGPPGRRQYEGRIIPEFDGDGQVTSLLGITTDSTLRKQSEGEIRRFKAMSDSAHDVCFCADAEDSHFTYVNRRAAEQLGIPEEQLLRMRLADVVEGFDLAAHQALARDLADKRQAGPTETVFKRHDGASFPVEISWSWLEFDGRPHVCGVARDISERKRAEESLRVSRERLDLVVQSTGLGLWYCDLPFDKLLWNERCKEHFGLPPDAEVTIDTFFERLHPDDRARTREAIDQTIQTGAPFDLDYRTVARDGRQRWVRSIGRCFYSAYGKPLRFDGVTVDTTERKRVEEALKETDRRKDEFLAMLSHELRNPLAAIRNAMHLFDLRQLDNPTLQEAREVLDRQSQILAGLVDDLLDVFRITHQKIALNLEPQDLASLARLTVGDLQSAMDHHGLRVVSDLPDQPVWVLADRIRLSQVLTNLLNNAAKFTKRGGRITVSIATETTPRPRAVVRVQDTGIGIHPDMLPHIFDTFCQADPGLARSGGGLGLGLALVKGLVEMHGGKVSAASPGLGQGAVFTISLPLTHSPKVQALAPAPPPTFAAGRKLRILIVEDNRDTARTLRLLLQRYGHVVESAHNGREGVEKARSWNPDVVLCDLGLPEMDGYEVARTLRSDQKTADTRLIAVSGYGQEEDRNQSGEAGFDLHLTKPVDPIELQRLLSVLKVGP